MGKFFRSVVIPSLKIVNNLPRTYEKLSHKGESYRFSGYEILWYRQTNILLLCFKDLLNCRLSTSLIIIFYLFRYWWYWICWQHGQWWFRSRWFWNGNFQVRDVNGLLLEVWVLWETSKMARTTFDALTLKQASLISVHRFNFWRNVVQ